MPKIFFENEYREVECEAGEALRDVAIRNGINVDRLTPWLPVLAADGTCGGTGLCGTCQVWIKESSPGSSSGPVLSPITLRERFIHGMKGWRRLACMTRVQGDIHVFTAAGGPDRLVIKRPIAVPPSPVQERLAAGGGSSGGASGGEAEEDPA